MVVTIKQGDTDIFRWDSTPRSGGRAVWSSAAPGIVAISELNPTAHLAIARGVAAGTTTITATQGALTATIDITVRPAAAAVVTIGRV